MTTTRAASGFVVLCALACAALSGCTLLIGHEDEQDLAAPDDMSVPPMDASSTDLARNFMWTATQQSGQANLNDVWAGTDDAGTVVYAVGDTDTIFLSTDEGDHFTAIPPPVPGDFTRVWGRTTSDIYIGGAAQMNVNFVLRGNATAGFSRDNFNQEAFAAYPVTALWNPGPNEPILAATGTVVYSTDGTGTWNVLDNAATLQAFWGTTADDVWALGDPFVYHAMSPTVGAFVDTGQDFLTANGRTGMWGVGSAGVTQSLWVVGAAATIERHDNGQTGWTVEHTEDGGAPLFDVWGTSENDLYAVGDQNHILHRTASGWSSEDVEGVPTNITIAAVFGLPDGRVFAVGQFGWIFVRKPLP